MVKLAVTLWHRLGFEPQHHLERLVRIELGDELYVGAFFQLLALSRQAATGARSQARQHSLVSARQRQLVLNLTADEPSEVTCRAHQLDTSGRRSFHGDAYTMDTPLLQKCLGR